MFLDKLISRRQFLKLFVIGGGILAAGTLLRFSSIKAALSVMPSPNLNPIGSPSSTSTAPELKYGYHINKFDPTKTIMQMVGTGFKNSDITSVWSDNTQIAGGSDIIITSDTTMEFVVHQRLGGDHILVKLMTGSGLFSNEITVRINTYLIAVFGDSVAWGQGLREDRKYYSLVAESMKGKTTLNVSTEVYAHSGAIIGSESLPNNPGVGPEVPYDYPTILQQVDNYSGIPEQIDLVLMDGGINDVGLTKIVERKFVASVINDTVGVFSTLMPNLLNRVKTKFTNSRVVVLGYYQIISESTNILVLEAFFLLILGVVLGILAVIELIELRKHLSNNFEAFANTANQTMSDVINQFNQNPGPRILFADPQFTPSNALDAPKTLLWKVLQTDDVHTERKNECSSARKEVPGIPSYCEVASIGHPNAAGAVRYSNAILNVLPSDIIPPVITLPPTLLVIVEATGPSGAIVQYPVSAVDDVDGPVTATCNPPSGSVFPFGDTTVTCTATDKAGNSASAQFIVRVRDTTPPDTIITSVIDGNNAQLTPANAVTVSNKITISFKGTDLVGVAGLQCSLDNQAFSSCTSPVTLTNLRPGTHSFQVRAIDTSGNVDPTPAVFSWNILTPTQGIQQLMQFTNSIPINNTIKSGFVSRLAAANAFITDNDPRNDISACDELNAFILMVTQYANFGRITAQQASQLIHTAPYSAVAIKLALGCTR